MKDWTHLFEQYRGKWVVLAEGLLGHNGFFDNISYVKFRSLKGIVEIGARR